MQRIGVKQFLILKICCDKGYVWSGDVVDIYDIHLTPRSGKRAIIQLKKLEAYGYIKQDYETVGEVFRITGLGRNLVSLNIGGKS